MWLIVLFVIHFWPGFFLAISYMYEDIKRLPESQSLQVVRPSLKSLSSCLEQLEGKESWTVRCTVECNLLPLLVGSEVVV